MTNAWDDVLARRGVKPNGDGKTPRTATAGESEDDIRRRIAAEENQRALDITAACDLAGQPQRAAAFIADGKMTLSRVLATLTRAASPRPKG